MMISGGMRKNTRAFVSLARPGLNLTMRKGAAR
jgi:hypothetical protein